MSRLFCWVSCGKVRAGKVVCVWGPHYLSCGPTPRSSGRPYGGFFFLLIQHRRRHRVAAQLLRWAFLSSGSSAQKLRQGRVFGSPNRKRLRWCAKAAGASAQAGCLSVGSQRKVGGQPGGSRRLVRDGGRGELPAVKLRSVCRLAQRVSRKCLVFCRPHR